MSDLTRCSTCYVVFTDKQLGDAKACPSCGDSGSPQDPEHDVRITLPLRDLSSMIVWAGRWVECCRDARMTRYWRAFKERVFDLRLDDTATLTLNWLEIRCLTHWSENYLESMPEDRERESEWERIKDRVRKYRPADGGSLCMMEELEEIRRTHPGVTYYEGPPPT